MPITAKTSAFRFKGPSIDFTKELEDIAEKDVIPDIVEAIDGRVSIQRKGYRKLAPQTIRRKGHDRPLIDTGKLRSSIFFKKEGRNKVRVSGKTTRNKELRDILQEQGVRSKAAGGKRKFNFLEFLA